MHDLRHWDFPILSVIFRYLNTALMGSSSKLNPYEHYRYIRKEFINYAKKKNEQRWVSLHKYRKPVIMRHRKRYRADVTFGTSSIITRRIMFAMGATADILNTNKDYRTLRS